jgi:hypothetical protein
MKSISELIASARRELAMRKNVYPKWVDKGKMKPIQAQYELECQEAIVAVLEAEAETRAVADAQVEREP